MKKAWLALGLAGGSALLTALAACGGDDVVSPTDSGMDVPMQPEAGNDSPAMDSPPDRVVDSSLDSPIDSPPDVPVDSSADSPVDAGPDGDGGLANTVLVAPGGTFTFSPAAITVEAGTAVNWVWVGSGHTVTSGTVVGGQGMPDNLFCSPNDMNCGAFVASNAGAMYSHMFVEAGTFPYFCYYHAGDGMVGTVTVK